MITISRSLKNVKASIFGEFWLYLVPPGHSLPEKVICFFPNPSFISLKSIYMPKIKIVHLFLVNNLRMRFLPEKQFVEDKSQWEDVLQILKTTSRLTCPYLGTWNQNLFFFVRYLICILKTKVSLFLFWHIDGQNNLNSRYRKCFGLKNEFQTSVLRTPRTISSEWVYFLL